MNGLAKEKQVQAVKTLSLTGATVAALVIVAAGYYYASTRESPPEADVRKFTGTVVRVEGQTVALRGFFDGPPGTIPRELAAARDFSFLVDGTTRFEKKDIRWPTWEELAAQGTSGTFSIESLPATEGAGSLGDLLNLHASNPGRVDVRAIFRASIVRSSAPVASSVLYQLIGMAPPPPLAETP